MLVGLVLVCAMLLVRTTKTTKTQGARVSQTALMSAVMFSMFELCKAQLKQRELRPPEDAVLSPKLLSKRRGAVLKRQFVHH